MTVVGHANWWCSTCGARGSGNGAAYADWLRGHSCGMSAPEMPETAKPEKWNVELRSYAEHSNDVTIHGYPDPQSLSVPGRVSFTVLEKKV